MEGLKVVIGRVLDPDSVGSGFFWLDPELGSGSDSWQNKGAECDLKVIY